MGACAMELCEAIVLDWQHPAFPQACVCTEKIGASGFSPIPPLATRACASRMTYTGSWALAWMPHENSLKDRCPARRGGGVEKGVMPPPPSAGRRIRADVKTYSRDMS